MSAVGRSFRGIGGRVLFRLGRAGYLTTTGRRSGQPRRTPVGIVPGDAGTWLIGSGEAGRSWVANLRADPDCLLETRDGAFACRARELRDSEHEAAQQTMRQRMGRTGAQATFVEIFELVPTDRP
jgi:deazaflavin-dependent oxidoreductase (nitroreductase family)